MLSFCSSTTHPQTRLPDTEKGVFLISGRGYPQNGSNELDTEVSVWYNGSMEENTIIDMTILEIPFGDNTQTETISIGFLGLDDGKVSLDISIDGDLIEIGTAKELSEDRFGEGYWHLVMAIVYRTYANLVQYKKDLVCGTTGKVLAGTIYELDVVEDDHEEPLLEVPFNKPEFRENF